MKTTKVNRIELDKKDSNVEVVLGGGLVTIHVRPDGKPCVVVSQDDSKACGNPMFRITSDIYQFNDSPERRIVNERRIENEYTHGVLIDFTVLDR
jgi:hypothetical protein